MGIVIALVNQKGGVGKTTTAVNLSASLSLSKKKTLLIDFDPQGNATTGMGIDKKILEFTIYDAIINNTPIQDLIIPLPIPLLYLVPANVELAGAEIEFTNIPDREKILKKRISEIKEKFDYILIDCPPSLGLLTINVLVCAEFLLVPVQCEYYAMEGLVQLFEVIGEVKKVLNPNLGILGILPTMADKRTNLSYQVVEEIKKFFPEEIFRTIIPRNVRVSEAPSYGKPVILYAPHSSGAKSYRKLTKEVMRRVQKRIR